MANRKFTLLAVLLLAVYVASAQAQCPAQAVSWAAPTSPNRIGDAFIVSKCANADDPSDVPHFTTIQEAVNTVPSGSIIQIMDTSVYAEQVTIDGLGINGPWYHWLELRAAQHVGVERISPQGKSRITIIYIPPGGWPSTGAHTYSGGRPTIRFQDTYNAFPANDADTDNSCDLPSDCQTICATLNPGRPQECSRVTNNNRGGAGNFENNGALRIISTTGVTIDGIRVDGGGAWGRSPSIWGGPQFFGNAAITISGSGSITIRNSEIVGASNGIAFKDRNAGGVFANKNEHDLDESTPLGNFGAMGNHIIEYNRIHRNRRGIFFESGWDLGLYVRHNFIFNNNHSVAVTGQTGGEGDRGGGIFSRDHIFQPVAVHNNTFYNNTTNMSGGWQVGAPHLIYNNIYGAVQRENHFEITGLHRNRLHNSVFSAARFQTQGGQNANFVWGNWWLDNPSNNWPADLRALSRAEIEAAYDECRTRHGPDFMRPGPVTIQELGYYSALINHPNATQADSIFAPHLRASNTFTTTSGVGPYPCRIFISGYDATATNPADMRVPAVGNSVTPGAALRVLPTANGNRFLQTEGHAQAGYDLLFQSLNPMDPGFLIPIWTHADVQAHIRGRGWQSVNGGTRAPGTPLDLGAVQSTQRAPVTAHIVPTNVVMVDTNTRIATVNYRLNVRDANGRNVRMENPQITHLRWVEPLPHTRQDGPYNNEGPGGSRWPTLIVTEAAHTTIDPPVGVAINSNSNSFFTFQVPRIPGTPTTRDSVGAFLEIVVTGTVNGQQVSSNVGFLPYRLITHRVRVCVLPITAPLSTPTSNDACLSEVTAGEPYQLKIVPTRPSTTPGVSGQEPFTENVEHVEFRLQSGGDHAYMWCRNDPYVAPPGSPGSQPANGIGTGAIDYNRSCPQPGAPGGDFPVGHVGGRNETYLAADRNIRAGARYHVFFSYAGDETIFVTAQTRIINVNVAFLGTADIRVRPATPSQVAFINPLPRSQLETIPGACAGFGANGPNREPLPDGCLRAQLITRGSPYNVDVEVQDRFGNATDQAVMVSIASDAPMVGDAGVRNSAQWQTNKTVLTNNVWGDPDMGRAQFVAHVVSGDPTQYFDMTATATHGGNTFSDIGRLRLGRPLNQLRVFFSDLPPGPMNCANTDWPCYYDASVTIEGQAIPTNEYREQITVKATTPTEVATSWGGWVSVAPSGGQNDAALRFYASQTATEPQTIFPAANGEVTFWVGVDAAPTEDIISACITVNAWTDAAGQNSDGNYTSDRRCGITLRRPQAGIAFAEVLGDGDGRPTEIRLSLMSSEGITASSYDDMIRGIRFIWPPNVVAGAPAAGAAMYEFNRATSSTRFRPTTTAGGGFEMRIDLVGLTEAVGELTPVPLPTGHTSIQGNGMGVVQALMTSEDSDVPVYNGNFNTHDGIGPIIADTVDRIDGFFGPMILENTNFCTAQGVPAGCRADILTVQVTEPIRQGLTSLAEDSAFYIVRVARGVSPASATPEVLMVDSVMAGGRNGFRLFLNPSTPIAPRLETDEGFDYYLRFVPGTPHVQDFAQSLPNKPVNNTPHLENRWVKIDVLPTPPERVAGWYTADVRTGFLDTATIQFDKSVVGGWFRGSTIRMGTGALADTVLVDSAHVFGPEPQVRIIDGVDRDGNPLPNSRVKFCLRTFHPRSQTRIITGGTNTLNIDYSSDNAATREWQSIPHSLDDHAKPVIANVDGPSATSFNSARIIFGGREILGDGSEISLPDTIVVWVSEQVSEITDVGYVGQPLELFSADSGYRTPELRLHSVGTPSGIFRELKFTFNGNDARLLDNYSPDSVRLNYLANVTDVAPNANVQDDSLNRRVSLRIVRVPNWDIVIKNNPGRPGIGGGDIEIVVKPFDRAQMEMRATIELYDNVGNIVRTWSTCDGTLRDADGEPFTCNSSNWANRVNGISWTWDGLNHRGRYAGTGTYLFRARYEAHVIGSDGRREAGSHATRRLTFPIGVVR